MFNRTTRAAAWVASTTEPIARPEPVPSQRSGVGDRVLWALRPLAVRSGTCVALRVDNGVPTVGLRANEPPHRLQWIAAHQVLTETEALRWAKGKFSWR